MKVMLIGCGAVGLSLAAALYDRGHRVDLIAKGATRESIEKNGIIRKGLFKEIVIPKTAIRIFSRPDETRNLGYDFVLIAAKTIANPAIAAQLAACGPGLLGPSGCLVLCQNGFDNERHYFGMLAPQRIYSASFSIGFRRPEPHVSEITVFSAPVAFGSLFGGDITPLHPLAETIDESGLPCKVSTEITKRIWAKLLYNCTLNPLSAILRTSYGGLVRSPETMAVMNGIIEEIFAVMQAAGYSTYWENATLYQQAFYETILPPTYQHRSSTLQDVERGIKTEIDSLTGSIIRLGAKYGIDTPCNTLIYRLIKGMEAL